MKIWRLVEVDSEPVRRLSRALQIPAFLARLLVLRGVSEPGQARRFLAPSLNDLTEPDALAGAEEAAERIVRAVRAGQKICVYGDYDADGVCATAILVGCLKLAGADVEYYIPQRIEEGYGLNRTALEHLRTERRVDLLVTVDCGIRSVEEARHARQLGMDLIVTDHHHPGAELPEAEVIVHPRLNGSDPACATLCGAGIALKLAWAIARRITGQNRLPPRYREYLRDCLLLAAVATVADVVPLLGENRVLVHYGLKALRKAPPLGLAELMRLAGVDREHDLPAETIAYRIAPRLNAVGRLGHARHAVELLMTRSTARAEELARHLDQLNGQRQSLENRIYREALELTREDPELAAGPALVLGKPSWHPGIVGIVAARLVRRFWKPTVLITTSAPIAQGSGRSIPGYDLCAALEACREWLLGYGGHAAAVGVRMKPHLLDQFRRALVAHAEQTLGTDQPQQVLTIDSEVALAELTVGAVRWVEAMGPFGQANQRPLLLASDVELLDPPRVVGKDQRHLMFRVRQHSTSMQAVAFGMAERAQELVAGNRYDVVFHAQLNHYQGYTSVRMEVHDFRPADG